MSCSFGGRARFGASLVFLALLCGSNAVIAQNNGSIRGMVVEKDGSPIAGATVMVLPDRRQTISGDRGEFVLSGLRIGSHQLSIQRFGYQPVSRDAEASTDPTYLRIELVPTAVELNAVTVIGSPLELAERREELRRVPGGVALIEPRELRNSRQANLTDVLRFTPGVWAQPRFGAADETQLSIRGSGLRNNFHMRGVNVLVNNMPYRNADGFTDFESLELATAHSIQVFKGANALRYGGSTLGGAINLETKTGYTAERANLMLESGAFGFLKGQASSGAAFGPFDYYASYARTELDGQRQHSAQLRDRMNAHIGYVISPRLDARAFYFFANVKEDLPGSLTRAEFDANPGMATPQNVTNDWGRDYSLHHFGLQFRGQLGKDTRLDVAPYMQYRDIVHPIFRVLDQISRDFGTEARLESSRPIAGRENSFTLGAQYAFGNIDNQHFDNVGGSSGTLRKDQRDEAGTQAIYVEDVLRVAEQWSAVVGARYARDLRRVDDRFLSDGDQSGERWYSSLQPKVGVLFDLPGEHNQFFASVGRTYEPPLLIEVNSLTVPGLVDLNAQDAWQFELGTRGSSGLWNWDVSLFDMEIRDELLNQNVRPFPNAPFTVPTYRNAERTRHLGGEAAIGFRMPGSIFTSRHGGDQLVGRVAYTYGRFTFESDSLHSGNRIPGAPTHVLQGELAYRHPLGITLRPSLEWVPDDYFVNSENTVSNDGWLVAHMRAELELPKWFASLFVEGRNLGNTRYSPAVTVDDAAGRYFLPGEERSLYVGVRYRR
jgi:iron complex outermembrane recepter protein